MARTDAYKYVTVAIPIGSRLHQAIEEEARASGIKQQGIVIRNMLEKYLDLRSMIVGFTERGPILPTQEAKSEQPPQEDSGLDYFKV